MIVSKWISTWMDDRYGGSVVDVVTFPVEFEVAWIESKFVLFSLDFVVESDYVHASVFPFGRHESAFHAFEHVHELPVFGILPEPNPNRVAGLEFPWKFLTIGS